MIRLTLALLAVMFLTFLIAGADHGQVRYGLMTTGGTPVAAETRSPATVSDGPSQAATDVVDAVYVPTQTLIDPPDATTAPAVQTELPADVTSAEPAVAPLAEPEKLVLFIAAKTVNVREGPGKDFAVIDKLSRGEAVTVVSLAADPEGWTLITIQGDGIEGYVSNALLSDQP